MFLKNMHNDTIYLKDIGNLFWNKYKWLPSNKQIPDIFSSKPNPTTELKETFGIKICSVNIGLSN